MQNGTTNDNKTTSEEPLRRKAGTLVASRAITVAAQLAAIVVLTRILSKEDFGLLTFFLLAYATILTLSRLGLPDSVFYFIERLSAAKQKTFILLTSRNLFLIGLLVSTALIPLSYFAPKWGFEIDDLILPFTLLILLELPTIPIFNTLIAINKVRQAALFNIGMGMLQFIALVVPGLLGYPVATIVYVLLIYGTFKFIVSTYLFLRHFPGPMARLEPGTSMEQFRYSIPLGISQILWDINRQIDKYIVAGFLPIAVYAEYTIGAWEIPFIPAIAYSVSLAMMPNLVSYHSHNNKEALLYLWRRGIRKVSLLVLPLAILFVLVAEELIAVLFTESYIAAALPFRIYTLILLHRVASYSSLFKAIGDTKYIYYSAVYLVLINIAFSFPLVIWIGIAGPPLATLIANFVTWGYALNKLKYLLNVSLSQVFPFRIYLGILAVAIIAAIPAFIIKLTLNASYSVKLFVLAIVYMSCYALLAVLTRIIRNDEWKGFLPNTITRMLSKAAPSNP